MHILWTIIQMVKGLAHKWDDFVTLFSKTSKSTATYM